MVAEKICNYMKDKGIKATVIAQKAGITQQQMSAILTQRTQLKADVFFRICEALEVSPEMFAPEANKEISA
jgi:transcriptional regulator with XRE-family HTH domain